MAKNKAQDQQQAPTTTEAPAPTQTKAEALAAERAAKRAEKEAAKEARKAANKAKREDGVIGTIKAALSTPAGVTKSEMLAQLQAKFPDRDPMGMACTVGIQFSRLSKTRKVVNRKLDRGRVYGFQDTVQFPEVTIEAVNAKPAPDSQPLTTTAAAPLEGRDAIAALSSKGKGKGKGKSK